MSNCWFQHWEINTSKQKKPQRNTIPLSSSPLPGLQSPRCTHFILSPFGEATRWHRRLGLKLCGSYSIAPAQVLPLTAAPLQLYVLLHLFSVPPWGTSWASALAWGSSSLLAFLPLYHPSCSGSFLISPLLLFGQFSCPDIVFSVSSCSSIVSHPAVTTLFYGAYAKNVFNLVWFIQVWCTVGLFCSFLSQLEMAVSSTGQFVTSCRCHPCATPTHPPATETLQFLPNKILFWYTYKSCSVLLRLGFFKNNFDLQ